MTAFFNDIQWMSLICSDSSRMTFTTLSVIFVILSILVRFKNQDHRPIHSLYHYTSYDRMFQILRSGCMKGGHHGVVFTTANKRYQNRGTVRPRVFSKKNTTEGNLRARIIFRGKALCLFRNPAASPMSLFTGHTFMGEINDEFITRRKGNLRLLKFRHRGQTLLVTDAEFEKAPVIEATYMIIMGFLLRIPKAIFPFIHIMAVLSWADYLLGLMWFRVNWAGIGLLFILMLFMSLFLAECIYMLLKGRIGLK